MKRRLIFWSTVLVVAVLAVRASAMGRGLELLGGDPLPEPARAAFLGAGILAVAYAYRRAWLNLTGG